MPIAYSMCACLCVPVCACVCLCLPVCACTWVPVCACGCVPLSALLVEWHMNICLHRHPSRILINTSVRPLISNTHFRNNLEKNESRQNRKSMIAIRNVKSVRIQSNMHIYQENLKIVFVGNRIDFSYFLLIA